MTCILNAYFDVMSSVPTPISEEFLIKQYRLHALQRFYKKIEIDDCCRHRFFDRKITPKTSNFKNIFCLKFRNLLSLFPELLSFIAYVFHDWLHSYV